jgi:hypothetical protein
MIITKLIVRVGRHKAEVKGWIAVRIIGCRRDASVRSVNRRVSSTAASGEVCRGVSRSCWNVLGIEVRHRESMQ